jgi:hypothetical protein
MKKTYEAPALALSGDARNATLVSGSEGPEGFNQKNVSAGSVGFAL